MTKLPPRLARRAVFVDSSAFFAFSDRRDQWHRSAREGFERLSTEGRLLFTSDLIVAETYRLFLQRRGREVALEWAHALADMNLLFHTLTAHERTLVLLATTPLPQLSYTDASSRVLMEAAGIQTIFSFDRDFDALGCERFPPGMR